MKTKRYKGYTLLEVLVTVLIIAILSSIVVPQYNKIINRADVAEALQNMNMLSEAQNKYLMKKGAYTNDLSALKIPMKGNTANISTTNFTYFAGDPREDNFCIYSKSMSKNYTLAKNYKVNSEVLCSGSNCDKISSLVQTGDLPSLCGGEYSGECNVECSFPKILSTDPCGCVCDPSTCLGYGIQDEDSCQCKCLGQSTYEQERYTCVCDVDAVKQSCIDSGYDYDAENCDCIYTASSCENTCNAIQVLNPSNCSCSCADNISTGNFCQLGRMSNNCDCECPADVVCEGQFDEASCSCTCDKTQEDCPTNYVLDPKHCICEEKQVCSDEQISACSGDNKILQDDCSCKCDRILFCGVGYVFNSTNCECEPVVAECNTSEEACTNAGKIFNSTNCSCECPEGINEEACNGYRHFDFDTCSCVCDLTDEICAAQSSKAPIANISSCQCESSNCPDEIPPCYNNNGHGHYSYRICQCVCDLTEDDCKAEGLRLKEATCECLPEV